MGAALPTHTAKLATSHSGAAATNVNFVPVPSDWKDRVKRARLRAKLDL